METLKISWKVLSFFFASFISITHTNLVLADHDLQDSTITPNHSYEILWSDDNPYDLDLDNNGSCDIFHEDDVPSGGDANYFPSALADSVSDAYDNNGTFSIGNPNGHHQGFEALSFTLDDWRSPTSIYDCSPHGGCDSGSANKTYVKLPAPRWICRDDASLRLVVGHELFHHVQYEAGLNNQWSGALVEGSARMMQDQVYSDLDGDAGSLATYRSQARNFLSNRTNDNLFHTNMLYDAALFWKYASEQFGAWAPEPNLGTDFIRRLWDRAAGMSSSADLEELVEKTVQETHPELSLNNIVQDFNIANIAKEYNVSNLNDGIKYLYQDLNDGVSGTLTNVPRRWDGKPNKNGTDTVNKWGARYYEADLINCPNGIAGFSSIGDRAGYALLVIKDDDSVERIFKGVSDEYTKAIILSREQSVNSIRRLVAVTSGLGEEATYEYDFACGAATLDIIEPTDSNLSYVGTFDNPERFTIKLRVQGPSELGIPTVQGLDPSDFEVFVGSATPGNAATIISGAQVQGEYWIVAKAPQKTVNGDYDLIVRLRDIASDYKEKSIRYEEKLLDKMIVIDASGSMLSPSGFRKIDAARNAASILSDATGSDSQIGAVSFNGNNTETDDDAALVKKLLLATDTHRNDVKNAILNISDPTASALTSIGDGLEKARQEYIVRGTTIGEDVITLLSDGMENEGLFVSDVLNSLTSSGIKVNTIALGPQADQPLLEGLANDTGGTFYYVDVGTTAPIKAPSSLNIMKSSASTTPLSYPLPIRLADVYLSSYEKSSGSERIFELFGSESNLVNIDILVKETQVDDARITFAWDDPSANPTIKVFHNNSLLIDGVDGVQIFQSDTHVVVHYPGNAYGSWTIEGNLTKQINYFAALSGRSVNGANLRLAFDQILDPNVLNEGGTFKFGKPIRILTTIDQPDTVITNLNVVANIKHPNGSIDTLPLFDDGEHNDGEKNDGIYASVYRRTNVSSPTGLNDGSNPDYVGSYQVVATVNGDTHSTPGLSSETFNRIIKASFVVFSSQESMLDRDYDSMPDEYEKSLLCLDKSKNDANIDFDNDGLTNFAEWQNGTNPCEQDTDFGGINDGSELTLGLNPFDAEDDFIPTPRMVEIISITPEHLPDDLQLNPGTITIRYPSNTLYQSMRVFRSDNPDGPFSLISEFSPDGSSIFRDDSGVIGTTYYYHFQAVGSSNALTGWSPVVSGTLKNDPSPPIGGARITEGPITSSTNVNVSLFNDDSGSTEYRIKNMTDVSFSNWSPMNSEIPWIINPDVNGDASIVVQYKDSSDNLSIQYIASTRLVPSSSVGSIEGSVSLSGDAPDSLESRIRISVIKDQKSLSDLPPVYTDNTGNYVLGNIPEGHYTLSIEYANEVLLLDNIIINGGSVTTIPNQNLEIMPSEFNTPVLSFYFMLVLSLILITFSQIRRSVS